jgi:TIR domain
LARRQGLAIHAIKEFKIFYSYAPGDEELLIELDTHLMVLQREKLECWDKRKLLPGMERTREVQTQMEAAHIILLLLSPNYAASDECYDIEMQYALKLRNMGKAHVIPIILSPIDLKETFFETLEVLPRGKKPITVWDNRDEAFAEVVSGIKLVISNLTKKRLQDEAASDTPDKKAMRAAFAAQIQKPSAASSPLENATKHNFRRELVIKYDLEPVIQAFKAPLVHGKAFGFVIAGEELILRNYVIERLKYEFQEAIRGEHIEVSIDLDDEDLEYCSIQSLIEEKIKSTKNVANVREMVKKHSREHVILTIWNDNLPLLTAQEALTAFWQNVVSSISTYLHQKNLCFVIILAHLPSGNQPCNMDNFTSLYLPPVDVKGHLCPAMQRDLFNLGVPKHLIDNYLKQLQDIHDDRIRMFRRLEYIASSLQGEYDRGRFNTTNVRPRKRSL